MNTNLLSIALLLSVNSTTSCTSFKPLPETSDYTTELKKGDMIHITFSDGSEITRFKIKQVFSDTLKGSIIDGRWIDKTISTAQISTLKKRKFSAEKTIALTVGVIIIISPFYFLVAAH